MNGQKRFNLYDQQDQPSCADCQWLHAQKYGRKTLYFCQNQAEGQYGNRRPKYGALCDYFTAAEDKRMPCTDARTGAPLDGVDR